MPPSYRVLLLDDDPDVRSVGPSDLKRLLESRGIESKIDAVESVKDALDKLEKEGYHVAIVDLHLAERGGGNEVLRSILAKKILPIIVYTGHKDELYPEFEDHGFIHVIEKKKMRYVADKIVEWHGKKVLDFFSEEGFIGTALHATLQKTMWGHVSKYWKYLETEDPTTLDQTAGRIAATLLHDALVSSPSHPGEGGETRIHHAEIYIFDTPRRYLAVGDLIRWDDGMLVVLTPSCDLVLRTEGGSKAKEVLVARCQDLATFAEENEPFKTKILELSDSNENKKTNATQWIEQIMRHGKLNDDGRRFFLPPFAKFEGGVVDFLALQLLPYGKEQCGELVDKRVLSLNREVATELSARFTRYMIRLGQASYQTEPLVKAVKGVLKASGSDKSPT